MLLKSINAMLLMLYLIYSLLAKAILLAIIKIVYFPEFSSFIALKIGLISTLKNRRAKSSKGFLAR
jgi:hypothetical protein